MRDRLAHEKVMLPMFEKHDVKHELRNKGRDMTLLPYIRNLKELEDQYEKAIEDGTMVRVEIDQGLHNTEIIRTLKFLYNTKPKCRCTFYNRWSRLTEESREIGQWVWENADRSVLVKISGAPSKKHGVLLNPETDFERLRAYVHKDKPKSQKDWTPLDMKEKQLWDKYLQLKDDMDIVEDMTSEIELAWNRWKQYRSDLERKIQKGESQQIAKKWKEEKWLGQGRAHARNVSDQLQGYGFATAMKEFK